MGLTTTRCRWCRKNDPAATNANGWCKECETRDKMNPPERSITPKTRKTYIPKMNHKPEIEPEYESDWPFPWMEHA